MATTKRPWRESTPTQNGAATIVAQNNSAQLIADVYGLGCAQAIANAELIVRAVNSYDVMITALHSADRLIKEALPKFSWGASALDANAITLLNDVPREIAAALEFAKESL